jgi:hypothetical protein
MNSIECISKIISEDSNTFNNLLESDFMTACEINTINESTVNLDIERSRYDKIRSDINRIFENTISSIAYDTNNFINNFKTFLENDKLYEKYSSSIPLEEGSINEYDYLSDILNIDNLKNIYKESVNNIDIDYSDAINEDRNNLLSKIDDVLESQSYIPDVDLVHRIYECNNIIINNIKESVYKFITDIKELNEESYSDNSINVYSENVDNDSVHNLYYVYDLSSSILKEALDRINIYKDLVIREISDARKALIYNGYKSKGLEESCIASSLIRSSDMYVYDKFFSQEVK